MPKHIQFSTVTRKMVFYCLVAYMVKNLRNTKLKKLLLPNSSFFRDSEIDISLLQMLRQNI